MFCSLSTLTVDLVDSRTHSLRWNSIGDEGAKELAAALRTNTSLINLS
jgi:hypothetical protein